MAVSTSRTRIDGPAGKIEVVTDLPAEDRGAGYAILCHPHPVYGGTLDNKVVYTLARGFGELGMPAVRFNFRGVGRSEGAFDDGIGEREDLRCVADWASARFAGRQLWLGGFSFGSGIAALQVAALEAQKLLLVAPPVTMDYFGGVRLEVETLVVHGDRDQLVPVQAVVDWVAGQPANVTLRRLPDADHFFNGQLEPLRSAIRTFGGGGTQRP